MKVIWLFLFLSLISSGQKKSTNDIPSGLMIEFMREPGKVSILDRKPEFSWIVPEKAGSQTAYQIIVSSSKESLERDEADFWNSNKTPGSKSVETEYSGKSLSDNSAYFWKVRIWDMKGKPSQWSEIQSFRTGLLKDYGTTANRFVESLSNPEKLVKTGDKAYFADFGKDAFGTFILELSPEKKDTIIVHLGEKTEGSDRIDRNPGGTIRYHSFLLPVEPGKTRYTIDIPPDERNTGPAAIHLPDTIGVITPFRYCEIENCSSEITSSSLFRKAFTYYFDNEMSSFECSDTTLNRIWEFCKYSIKATSFAGIYIDGDRERIPYEADAYINQLGHYYTDREYSMARITNEYFINHPTWPTEWILHTVPLFFNDLMHTGNYESIAKYYNELKAKTLISLARQDGLISSKNATDETMAALGFSSAKDRIKDIVDWPPSQKDTGWKLATEDGERDGYDMVNINTVVNAFHYHNLVLMERIAGYFGRMIDSMLYHNQAEKVKSSFNRIFIDPSKGIYLDGESSVHSSLHANMMALAFDLVPDKNKKQVIEFVKSRGMACSVYGAQYLLEGLYNAGEADYAFRLMTSKSDRSWWNMIRSGSTITMEAWDMKYKPNSDWNHAWGAAPANIIPGYLWGIKPVQPGYSKAVIRPQLGGLTSSTIRVPTIRGSIIAEFRDSGKSKQYIITLPVNMECDFIIPDAQKSTITFNGKKLKSGTGIIRLNAGNNKILF